MGERSETSVRGQRGRGMGGHSVPGGGLSNEWYTPPGMFKALGLAFDLDPCHPVERLSWIPAAKTFSLLNDGLAQPWEGKVWMNPPYGGSTDVWLERFVEHGNGVALVFARTETEWFHRSALSVETWCFIRGRITFLHADATPSQFNAGAPSMLMAMGEECCAAVIDADLGITVNVNERTPRAQATIWSLDG